MYINLEGKEVEKTLMTKGFLVNAIARYDALCITRNIPFEELRELKATREELKIELAFRLKRKFKVLVDTDPIQLLD